MTEAAGDRTTAERLADAQARLDAFDR
jgi:hypothetical protein